MGKKYPYKFQVSLWYASRALFAKKMKIKHTGGSPSPQECNKNCNNMLFPTVKPVRGPSRIFGPGFPKLSPPPCGGTFRIDGHHFLKFKIQNLKEEFLVQLEQYNPNKKNP